MWLYGEVLQSLPTATKRILIDLPLKPPQDEVRYDSKCGGMTIDESTIIWRTKANILELFEYSISGPTGSVIIQFPRHVQIYPDISISETKKGVMITVISQASIHLVDLISINGQSMLSDLTSSSFKKCFHHLSIPLSITEASSIINSDRMATIAVSAKGQSTQIFQLSKDQTLPTITELKSQSMFGRLLWSGSSAAGQPRIFKLFTIYGQTAVIALCQDEVFRIWNINGDCIFSSGFTEAESSDQNSKFSLESYTTENELRLHLQIDNRIYRLTVASTGGVGTGDLSLTYYGSLVVPNASLNTFKVFENGVIWAECEDSDGNESIKVVSIAEDGSIDSWRDVSPLRAPELVGDAVNYLLQSDVISDFALRKALSQMTRDEVPADISSHYIEKLISDESMAQNIDKETFIDQLYSIIIEYHFEAIRFSGFASGVADQPPIIIRQSSISVLRPLNGVEAVCSGYPVEKSGLSLGRESQLLLNGVVIKFSDMICGSEVFTVFQDKVQNGENPLDAAFSLQDELDLTINEHIDADLLKSKLSQLTNMISDGSETENEAQLLSQIFSRILTYLEPSPITKDTDSTGELNLAIEASRVSEMKILANSVRSATANMLSLSQLLLLLLNYIVKNRDLIKLKTRLANLVSDYTLMQWVCNARGIRRFSKNDQFMSSISLTTTIMNQSQSTLIGDSFVSMSHLPNQTILQQNGNEEPLLELWLAQLGYEQAESLRESIVPSSPSHKEVKIVEKTFLNQISIISQLISPSNRLHTIPTYLLETNQIDLLNEWVSLNTSTQSSLAYLKGVCLLHDGNTTEAVDSFQRATADLSEDFMLAHVLKNSESHAETYLRTSYYLEVLDKFKGFPNEQVELAQAALDQADPADDRVSMLWTKLFKLNLQLEDYPAAYTAMTSNTDKDRRKDCLRNFVLHLSEKGDLAPLVEAPYGGLEEEISSILENRALAVSAHDTRYFDLLFAFHITKENFRQAAKSMYLHATRLKAEKDNVTSIQLRETALLTAINCLNLALPDNQWIAIGSKCEPGLSPKRDCEGEVKLSDFTTTTVVDLADIENELKLVQARLLLADSGVDSFALSPSEVSSLLCKHDMHNEACELLIAFNIELEQPIASLAKKYSCAIGRPGASEIEIRLTEMLEKREKRSHSTTLYRVACEEILKFGHMIPDQMLALYKSRDMNEVLRLLTKYGEIEESVEVAIDILSRAKMVHKTFNSDSVGLIMNVPVQLIEQLNYFLKTNNAELHERLESNMESYLNHLEKTMAMIPELNMIGYSY